MSLTFVFCKKQGNSTSPSPLFLETQNDNCSVSLADDSDRSCFDQALFFPHMLLQPEKIAQHFLS